jgi:hypothetical protein
MREIRPSGSEGGVTFKPPSLPLSRQRPARASRLQSVRPVGRVAGSLGVATRLV